VRSPLLSRWFPFVPRLFRIRSVWLPLSLLLPTPLSPVDSFQSFLFVADPIRQFIATLVDAIQGIFFLVDPIGFGKPSIHLRFKSSSAFFIRNSSSICACSHWPGFASIHRNVPSFTSLLLHNRNTCPTVLPTLSNALGIDSASGNRASAYSSAP